MQSMGDFSFKKSYSKLEREKMEWQKHIKEENMKASSAVKPIKENPPPMTETKKPDTKMQIEPTILETPKQVNEDKSESIKVPPVVTRLPLQMIQSEAEREVVDIHNSNLLPHKSLITTPQTVDKKRKFDAISTENTENEYNKVSMEKPSIKRVKKTDENQMESFEEMLAKSVKKVPKIQLEQMKSKEKEKLEKERALKELSIGLKDAVFRVEDPLAFTKELKIHGNSQSSEKKNKAGMPSRKSSNFLKQNPTYLQR